MIFLARSFLFIASAGKHSCFSGHRPMSNAHPETNNMTVSLLRVSERTCAQRPLCGDGVFSVIQRYCIVEADRVAARPRARRLPLDECKPREES
jgi:hypothetical protein